MHQPAVRACHMLQSSVGQSDCKSRGQHVRDRSGYGVRGRVADLLNDHRRQHPIHCHRHCHLQHGCHALRHHHVHTFRDTRGHFGGYTGLNTILQGRAHRLGESQRQRLGHAGRQGLDKGFDDELR